MANIRVKRIKALKRRAFEIAKALEEEAKRLG